MNGLIEQFGIGTLDGNRGKDVTFSLSFSNTKYTVFIASSYQNDPDGISVGYKISTKLSTGCRIAVNETVNELSYLFIGY